MPVGPASGRDTQSDETPRCKGKPHRGFLLNGTLAAAGEPGENFPSGGKFSNVVPD
jgi:hypothetical protein